VANVPTPSVSPLAPLPRKAATAPVAGAITRTRLLLISATYKAAPSALMAMPRGADRRAAVPTPLTKPAAVPPGPPPPASTVADACCASSKSSSSAVTPRVTATTVCHPESATKRRLPARARPYGDRKRTLVPIWPEAGPTVPPPTTVVTCPVV
jgi:hypothetical protein